MFDTAAFKTTDALMDLAIRHMNDQSAFIASKVFPIHLIPKSDYKWYQYDRSNLRRVISKKAAKAEADKIEFNVFNNTGKAILHKLAAMIDPQDERDADAVIADIETTAALQLAEDLLIDMEKEAVALATTSSNYPSGLTTTLTSGTDTFVDSGGDPIGLFKTAKNAVRQNCSKPANSLGAAYEVVEALRIHPQLIERIKYTGTALPDQLIMQLLGIQNLNTALAMENTAIEGAADTLATIWDDDVVIYYDDPAKATKTMTYGKCFMCTDLYTHKYEVPALGAKKRVKMIEMGWEYDLKFAAQVSDSDADSIAGYCVINAI